MGTDASTVSSPPVLRISLQAQGSPNSRGLPRIHMRRDDEHVLALALRQRAGRVGREQALNRRVRLQHARARALGLQRL